MKEMQYDTNINHGKNLFCDISLMYKTDGQTTFFAVLFLIGTFPERNGVYFKNIFRKNHFILTKLL